MINDRMCDVDAIDFAEHPIMFDNILKASEIELSWLYGIFNTLICFRILQPIEKM